MAQGRDAPQGSGNRGWQQYRWGQTDVSDGLGKPDLFFLRLLTWGSYSGEGSAGGRPLPCFHPTAWEEGGAESSWDGEGSGTAGG